MADIKIRISDIFFNKSAEFFSIEGNPNDVETEISRMYESLKNVCQDISNYTNGKDVTNGLKYIFFVFRDKPSKPSFCKNESVFLSEQKSGYFLFVYNEKNVAIFRQNLNLPKKLKDFLVKLEYDDFVKININKNTEYKQISMQNTDGADYAIRSKSFEGVDLKRNITAVTSSKFFIKSLRGNTKKTSEETSSFSVNFGTSRLNQYASKKSKKEIFDWTKEIFDKIEKKSKKSFEKDPFLSNFAVKQNEELNCLIPTYLLLDFNNVGSLLEKQTVKVFENGKEIGIQEIKKIIEKFEFSLELKKDANSKDTDRFIYSNAEYEIYVLHDQKKKKYLIQNDLLKNIVIDDSCQDSVRSSIEDILNDQSSFSLFFRNTSSVYSYGNLWKDSKIISNIEWLLNFVEPVESLKKVSFEKYDNKRNIVKSWDSKSEFHLVIHKLSHHKCLVCDDLGNEWADFIGINECEVEFFACKYKTTSGDDCKSASVFQDVVGQALKNLGNLNPLSEQLEKKFKSWEKPYGDFSQKGNTRFKMNRLVRGSLSEGKEWWNKGNSNPKFKKISSLVVNFLDKDLLKTNFDKVKQSIYDNEFLYQQLWLLSHFVNSCLEVGVTPRIYCCGKKK